MQKVLLVVVCLCLSGGSAFSIGMGDRVTINGYSSFEFEKQLEEDGKGEPNGSFDADLFDLVTNIQATNRLRIAADITWEHGAATEDGRGNAAVEYAFPEYTVFNWLKLRAGKMFIPFGIYNEIHTAKPAFLTVKEPLSTNKNHKFGSDVRFYPRWGCGIAVLGNSSIDKMRLDYILQVSNGDQEMTNPFEEDDNKEKAVAGRMRFAPFYGLRFGVSGYVDWATQYEMVDGEPEDSGNRLQLWSLGGQLEWAIADAALEFEFVGGSYDAGSDAISRWALTAMASYTLKERFTPYFRFELLEPNTDIDNDMGKMLVYGMNIQIATPLFLKIENNTIMADENNGRFSGGNNFYNEFKTAVAVGF